MIAGGEQKEKAHLVRMNLRDPYPVVLLPSNVEIAGWFPESRNEEVGLHLGAVLYKTFLPSSLWNESQCRPSPGMRGMWERGA